MRVESINNVLTKYTASWKALEALSDFYEGSHVIESAEYVPHDKTWYLVGSSFNLQTFFAKIFGYPYFASSFYVKLPDGVNKAYVLGVK